MENTVNFTTFEVINIFLNMVSIALSLILFVNLHTGDCRTACLTRRKTSDGNYVTREAKLSMHENPLTSIEKQKLSPIILWEPNITFASTYMKK